MFTRISAEGDWRISFKLRARFLDNTPLGKTNENNNNCTPLAKKSIKMPKCEVDEDSTPCMYCEQKYCDSKKKLNGTGANSANTGLVDSVPKWGENKCSFVTTVNRLGYSNCHCLPMLHKYATLVIFVMF